MQKTFSHTIEKEEDLPLPSLAPKLLWMGLLAAGVIAALIADMVLGSVRIPPGEVIGILTGFPSENEAWNRIIYSIRIPQAFTAILAGIALSIGGLQMQTLFKNPLAGPSVLGITSGASLGVAVIMLASGYSTTFYAIQSLGIGGGWILVIAATLGSGMVLLIILAISMRITDNVVLLIIGIMIGNVTIAIVSIWQYFSAPEQIQDYLLWTFGSLGGVTSDQLKVLAIAVIGGLLLALAASKYLNMLLLGENYARSMGLKIGQARIWIILTTSILAGSVTGFCGPITFIGIAVPHLCRSLFNTSDHWILIPACCLMGALIMLICDIIAQLPGYSSTLPINSVTALLGSPVVIWVILQKRNLKAAFLN